MVAPSTPGVAEARRPAPTDFPALQRQIGQIRQVDGRDYHDGAQVIRWLNKVLLEGNWSQRIIDHGRDDDEMWTLIELTAILWSEDDEGMLVPATVVFQEFGSHRIQWRRGAPGVPVSIGNDRKAAVTDGLKRCARLLGIGLYLWDNEDEWELPTVSDPEADAQRARQLAGSRTGTPAPRQAPQQPDQPQQARPAATRAPVPQDVAQTLDPSVRASLENKYAQLTCDAVDLGMQASWVGDPSSKWTDAQLPKYIGLLENFIERNAGRARRGAA